MKYDKAIVITNPMIAANKSAEVTLSKFIRVISVAYPTIQIVGGNIYLADDLNGVDVCNFPIVRAQRKIGRILNLISLQVKMAKVVMQYGKKDHPLFFWIGDKMILPYLAAKIKRCEINYFIYGNTAKEGNVSVFAKFSSHLIRWMARNANYACAESESVFEEWPGLTVHNKRIIHLYTEHIEMIPFEERTNTIGMLCRITHGKHVFESIHAFHELHHSYPEWRLEIIGSGVQEDECKRIIATLHAENYILMRGWIDHEKVAACTNHWKYLLFPTDTEGMPNSVIELMGRGIPVLASAVGGIKDIVKHGGNGWILAGTTVDDIMESLNEAINTPDYDKIAECANRSIDRNFSLSGAQRNVYEELSI